MNEYKKQEWIDHIEDIETGGVCSVENGVITPITTGTCIVTATCGSQSATCNVTVNSSSGGSTATTYTVTNNLSF